MNGLSLLLIRVVLAIVVLVACMAPATAQEVVEYIGGESAVEGWAGIYGACDGIGGRAELHAAAIL